MQCLVYFRVENEGHKIYGQNCFPLVSLKPGIKFVPLRTNGGELIPESGLFVRVKKHEDGELPTIPEDVTASLNLAHMKAPVKERKPRSATSPPQMNAYKNLAQPVHRMLSEQAEEGDDRVLTVEVHPS